MPIYRLNRFPAFPPPEHAGPDGFLAVGGDLSPARLIEAYRNGIFPWYEPGEEILWWCPDPRLILDPSRVNISRSLRATIRKATYEVRFDTSFRQVIASCGKIKRVHEDGTWISPVIMNAYAALHDLGVAHSVESWWNGELVGGLYGVSLGTTFFGESMFAYKTDASKVALAGLAEACARRGITMIDCQVSSEHLISMGAFTIPRKVFLEGLREGLKSPLKPGVWTE